MYLKININITMGPCCANSVSNQGEIVGTTGMSKLQLHQEELVRRVQATIRMYNEKKRVKASDVGGAGMDKKQFCYALTSENPKVKVSVKIGN